MKAEDFFRLALERIFDIDKSTLDKYFKDFKRDFKTQPNVLNSLQADVIDRNGNVIDSYIINQDIEKLKYDILSSNPEYIKYLFESVDSWLNLFVHEIQLQLDFAKESFNEYLSLKYNIPLNSKKIFKEIHHFSIHVGIISRLVDKAKTPTNSMRSLVFSMIIDDTDIDLFSMRKLRNHLEHFEERLDAWHYLNGGKPILDLNIFCSTTKGIVINECLRVLDIENDNIYILGEKFELNYLANLVDQIDILFKNRR